MSESFTFTSENQALAQKFIAKYPPGRQASAVLPLLETRPDPGRRLAAAGGDGPCGGGPRHGADPRL